MRFAPNVVHSRRERTERLYWEVTPPRAAMLIERDALIAARSPVRPIFLIFRLDPHAVGAFFVIMVNVPLLWFLLSGRVVWIAFRHWLRPLLLLVNYELGCLSQGPVDQTLGRPQLARLRTPHKSKERTFDGIIGCRLCLACENALLAPAVALPAAAWIFARL